LEDACFGCPKSEEKRNRGTETMKVVAGVPLNKEGEPQFVKMAVEVKPTSRLFRQEHISRLNSVVTIR
jgi:hypothetical protein